MKEKGSILADEIVSEWKKEKYFKELAAKKRKKKKAGLTEVSPRIIINF